MRSFDIVIGTIRVAAFVFLSATAGLAEEVTVAVASNFLPTLKKISKVFEAKTGNRLRLVNGSSGMLYAQIVNGAPYDLFLSADQDRIDRLQKAGLLKVEGRKTYAVGRLVVYAPDIGIIQHDLRETLSQSTVRRFALASPDLAPYGRAAWQVLESLHLTGLAAKKAVFGNSVAQTFSFLHSRGADVGFVALSQVKGMDGEWQELSAKLYDPILQDAGLLARDRSNAAAKAFFDYLSNPQVRSLIRQAGYGIPEG